MHSRDRFEKSLFFTLPTHSCRRRVAHYHSRVEFSNLWGRKHTLNFTLTSVPQSWFVGLAQWLEATEWALITCSSSIVPFCKESHGLWQEYYSLCTIECLPPSTNWTGYVIVGITTPPWGLSGAAGTLWGQQAASPKIVITSCLKSMFLIWMETNQHNGLWTTQFGYNKPSSPCLIIPSSVIYHRWHKPIVLLAFSVLC